jgi:hypothetical protein
MEMGHDRAWICMSLNATLENKKLVHPKYSAYKRLKYNVWYFYVDTNYKIWNLGFFAKSKWVYGSAENKA